MDHIKRFFRRERYGGAEMIPMAVTVADIITVLAAFVVCFIIAEIAKWHVRTHCQDNPEIIWIWLDEGDEPQGGHRVKSDKAVRLELKGLCPIPCA